MGSNYSGLKYNVDIVMCIDATGSMSPLIEMVKNNALNFYDDLVAAAKDKNKHINEARVRIVAFRDYIEDKDEAMLLSNFYTLPDQKDDLKAQLDTIDAKGGGDEPEDGLEALGFAIKSKWNQEGSKKRHVIVVWTDDATHELGFDNKHKYYPQMPAEKFNKLRELYPAKMAKDFNELTEWWNSMDPNAKRLLIYAPPREYWTTIANTWENAIMFPSEAANGLDKTTYGEILDGIVRSI